MPGGHAEKAPGWSPLLKIYFGRKVSRSRWERGGRETEGWASALADRKYAVGVTAQNGELVPASSAVKMGRLLRGGVKLQNRRAQWPIHVYDEVIRHGVRLLVVVLQRSFGLLIFDTRPS